MMVPFVVHDAEGRILRSGRCPEAQVAQQAMPGETAMIGDGRDDTHHVEDGRIVPGALPDPNAAAIAAARTRARARRYLAFTDWMLLREVDPQRGKAMPDEVRVKRDEAVRILDGDDT